MASGVGDDIGCERLEVMIALLWWPQCMPAGGQPIGSSWRSQSNHTSRCRLLLSSPLPPAYSVECSREKLQPCTELFSYEPEVWC